MALQLCALAAALPVRQRAPERPRRLAASPRTCGLIPRASLNPSAAQPGGDASAFAPPAALAAVATGAGSAALLGALAAPEKAAAPAASPATGADVSDQRSAFDWSRHWYALAALDALDPVVPTAVSVLGERMVLWRDATDTWHALRDACPHRLAPLSEGRIAEDGTLQCSYHGWRFSGCGACTGIPNASDAVARSSRARVVSFPTAQAQGLLWIFPCAGADAAAAAAAAPLPLIPGLGGAPGASAEERGSPYVRDFPFSIDTLAENLCDPAHVAYAHHGVAGNRERAGATPLRVQEPLSPRGFAVFTPGDPGRHPAQLHTFFAPSLVKIKMVASTGSAVEYGHGAAGGLYIYCTPLVAGLTRTITRRTVPAGAGGTPGVAIASALSDVAGHLMLADVFDGDLVILHEQERALRAARRAGAGWRAAYFLATAEDVGAACVRRWVEEFGGGGPFAEVDDADVAADVAPRRVLLDRWAQHAVHCAACRRAGRVARAASRGLGVASCVAAAAAAASLLSADSAQAGPLALATAAAAPALGAAAAATGRVDALLRFKDYVHGRS